MNAAISLLAGLLFGAGLVISGMAEPANVRGFLDITGAWNPRLAFVMAGAVLTAMPFFALARRRGVTLFGSALSLPKRWPPDSKLVGGAVLFGIGWGLSGLCPGPALVVASAGAMPALVFVGIAAVGYTAARSIIR